MADNHSTPRMEIARRFLGLSNQFYGPQRIPFDEEKHANQEFHVELIGSPKSWILLDCPNRLVDRYDPKELPDWMERTTATPDCPLYVGIDVFSLHPVFLYVETGEKIPGSNCTARSVKFKTIPDDGYKIKRHVVLHEYFLKDGALNFTEAAARGDAQVLGGIGRTTAWSNFQEQIMHLHNGEPVKPFEHPDHRNLPIDHSSIDDGSVYTEIELPYSLRLPCLTNAALTSRLFELAMDLQRLFPQDNIHLNEIIMAILVWCDHESDPTRHIEAAFLREDGSYVDPDFTSFHRVPQVDLIDFVAIWPHYLRFHEMNQLSTYIHPLRFVNALNNTAREAHRLPNNRFFFRREKNLAWEEVAMREVAHSKLHHDTDWHLVVPAFLSGSLLKRPTDWKPPPDNLGERLALPDIHMIGHPAYPAGDPTITRVITPLPWVNPVVDRTQSWEGQGNEPIVMESSVTTQRGFSDRWGAYDTLRLISGDQMTVAGPPRLLEPTDDPSLYEVDEGNDADEGELSPTKTLKTLSPVEQAAWRKKALEIRLAMAVEAGVPAEQLAIDELGLLTWPGIEACVAARLKRGSPVSQ